jgi:hypothetical protein
LKTTKCWRDFSCFKSSEFIMFTHYACCTDIVICPKLANKLLIHKYIIIFVIYAHKHFYFYHIYITFKRNKFFFVTDYIWSEGELWQKSIKSISIINLKLVINLYYKNGKYEKVSLCK